MLASSDILVSCRLWLCYQGRGLIRWISRQETGTRLNRPIPTWLCLAVEERGLWRRASWANHSSSIYVAVTAQVNPKSEAHRECKAIIYTTARDMRFEADTEVAGDGWIADVLVSTSQITIAFEVQLAGQTAEKTAERSSRYRASDVMPVWLTKSSIVTELSSHVPAFLLDATDLANIRVRLPEVGFVPLGEAVRQILMGEIPLKVDLDAYVPPWYQAEDHDALALSGEGLKILGYIALGILGLIGLVCFLDAHKARR